MSGNVAGLRKGRQHEQSSCLEADALRGS